MSSLKSRSKSSKQPPQFQNENENSQEGQKSTASQLKRQRSTTQRAMSRTLASTANLANLLPSGTLLAFHLLTPVFTYNGSCDSVPRILTIVLLTVLGISCFLSSFTDSVKAADGSVYYGIATRKGMWMFDYPDLSGSDLPELGKYRIRVIDWIHAVLTVLVFGAVALRDDNVVKCLYPSPEHKTKEVLDIVPVGVGLICSLLFTVFPTRRHGIGCPVTEDAPPKNS